MVGKLINRRINRFNAKFPDAIELMVRGLRSGLPIAETLGIVAGERSRPGRRGIPQVADKMKIGRTMEAALQVTADASAPPSSSSSSSRWPSSARPAATSPETLSNLSDVLRKRAQMKLKIRAMSSESKASAYIVGSLPFIVFGADLVDQPEIHRQTSSSTSG